MRIEAAAVDPGDARRRQPLSRQPGQVAAPVARPGRHETFRGGRSVRHERGADLLAHLIRSRADARPQPRQQPRRRGSQLGQGRLQHTAGQTAPAGMRRGDLAAVVGAEQHRQAVGGEDRKHGAGNVRDRRVRLRLVRAGQRPQLGHVDAVHLAQPARCGRQGQRLLQRAAVGVDRVGRIAAAQAQVETIERRRGDARPLACGDGRMYLRGRRPVGENPGLGHFSGERGAGVDKHRTPAAPVSFPRFPQ
jgi:hypothetical protein